jgi:hypothetical protein
MSDAKATEVTAVRLFSLALAVLIWLAVFLERPAEVKLQLPLLLQRVPARLKVVAAPTRVVEATVLGPRLLLVRPMLFGASALLDLDLAQPGTASYGVQDCEFTLDPELKVVRLHPTAFAVELAPR